MTARIAPSFAFLAIALLSIVSICSADVWECSRKCGEKAFERCEKEQKENAKNRTLVDNNRYHYGQSQVNSKKRFRGTANKQSRQVEDTLDFQIKMYFKAGFWQDEWRERKWCWTCWGDFPHCDEGDKVEIKWCDDYNPAQRWIYKPATDKYGRLSPSMNQTLCFELVESSETKLRLLPCDEDNDRQLFSGWKPSPKFELLPAGQNARCISQQHDPKNFEELIAEECDTARGDHTNYWGLYEYVPRGYLAPTFDSDMRSEDSSCIIDLDLMNNVPIMSGTPFQSPDHPGIFLEQQVNGNLIVRDGLKVLWESGVNEKRGNYFTKLQGDGNMLTYRGEPGEAEEGHVRVWSSGSSDKSPQAYFLGLDCGGEFVAIYSGTPNDLDDIIWSDGTLLPSGSKLSDPEESLATMSPSSVPSLWPSTMPSSLPSASPTEPPSASPSWKPTKYPTVQPTTVIPTPYPTASWTALPTEPPSPAPSRNPTHYPTWHPPPTTSPTTMPTLYPTSSWTSTPTQTPTQYPTLGSVVQTTPEPICKPYFLGLRRMESIRETWVFRSPDDDTLLLEQWNTANLAVRDGNRIIWESQQYNTTGEWYSLLQSNGDLMTFPGVPGSPTGTVIWESNSTTIDSDFFLGLDCERKYVAIFGGSPEYPDGSIIWKSPTYVW